MKLRNLVILWIVLSLAVGLYTYTLTQESYTYVFTVFIPSFFAIDSHTGSAEIALSFPIALWVVMPLTLFFIIVCLAIFVNKIRNKIQARWAKNDFFILIDQIHAQASGHHSFFHYKTDNIEKISRILQRFDITPNTNSVPSGVEKIDTFLNVYKALLDGESVDVRKLGVANDSPLVLLEKKNRFKKDCVYTVNVLKKNTEPEEVKKVAFLALLEHFSEIDVFVYIDKIEVDKDIARALLQSTLLKKIHFNTQRITDFIHKAEYTQSDILHFTIKLKKILDPDAWLRFAEELADKNENAEETYLYVLADLEMISSLNDRLKHHAQNEFVHIRAFADLRESGKNYPLSAFFGKLV